jgi:hypothetical protein
MSKQPVKRYASKQNRRMRLKRKQALILEAQVSVNGRASDDSKLLQQGPVKSGLNPRTVLSHYARPAEWMERPAKTGVTVQGGKVKRKVKARWS